MASLACAATTIFNSAWHFFYSIQAQAKLKTWNNSGRIF